MIYQFVRSLVDDSYDIDNPLRTDRLAVEIESTLPGKVFVVRCNSTVCSIEFTEELNQSESNILDNVVNAHKNNL